jgi:hypothetical protein
MLVTTQPTNLGYVQLDNRAAGQGMFEAATYTCTHCNAVVVMNPERTRERYKCRGCDHLICDNCGAARAAGAPCRTRRQIGDEAMEAAVRGFDSPSIILP